MPDPPAAHGLPKISSLLPLTHHMLAEALLITQQDRLVGKIFWDSIDEKLTHSTLFSDVNSKIDVQSAALEGKMAQPR